MTSIIRTKPGGIEGVGLLAANHQAQAFADAGRQASHSLATGSRAHDIPRWLSSVRPCCAWWPLVSRCCCLFHVDAPPQSSACRLLPGSRNLRRGPEWPSNSRGTADLLHVKGVVSQRSSRMATPSIQVNRAALERDDVQHVERCGCVDSRD